LDQGHGLYSILTYTERGGVAQWVARLRLVSYPDEVMPVLL